MRKNKSTSFHLQRCVPLKNDHDIEWKLKFEYFLYQDKLTCVCEENKVLYYPFAENNQ